MVSTYAIIETNNEGIIYSLPDELTAIGIEFEELMLKSMSARLKAVTVVVASNLALGLLSSWLYDKIKSEPEKEVVINGIGISAQTVTVQEINFYLCKNKPEDSKRYSPNVSDNKQGNIPKEKQ